MIKINENLIEADKCCQSCGRNIIGNRHDMVQGVKEIRIGLRENQATCITLCDFCREELINLISESDGWGKLLDIKRGDNK